MLRISENGEEQERQSERDGFEFNVMLVTSSMNLLLIISSINNVISELWLHDTKYLLKHSEQ